MEEDIDDLCGRAGELALLGVPGVPVPGRRRRRAPRRTFREIARLTKGAYCRFDAGSAAQLQELLSAVAVYAAGGRKALAGAYGGHGARASAAAAQVARPRASHAIPAAGSCGAAAVPAPRARLHDGQSAGAGAPAAHRRGCGGAGGRGHPGVARHGGLCHVAGGAGLLAAVGHGAFPGADSAARRSRRDKPRASQPSISRSSSTTTPARSAAACSRASLPDAISRT